jgi:hypothetical protein
LGLEEVEVLLVLDRGIREGTGALERLLPSDAPLALDPAPHGLNFF